MLKFSAWLLLKGDSSLCEVWEEAILGWTQGFAGLASILKSNYTSAVLGIKSESPCALWRIISKVVSPQEPI